MVRALCEGVGSWLHFEFAANRSSMFSERYLSSAVGQILSGQCGQRVHAEHRHPVLAPQMVGPGRRPEIDFVVFGTYPNIKFAVESKWIGHTKPSLTSVVWDLIRLELIAHAHNATCIFLLAGKRRSVESFVKELEGQPNAGKKRFWLKTDPTVVYALPMVASVPSHTPILRGIFAGYQSQEFPHKIVTRFTEPFPKFGLANQFVTYAWEVRSGKLRPTFKPSESKYYKVISAKT